MLGSELVIRALARRGVTTIFSLSGNQIMPLYDACIDANIRIVHVRHEAAAVFMADAWSQITGEIGVAMLTAAPGIANGIAPLYSASQAESPILLLSGDSPVSEDGMGAFQELDQVAMTSPLTKWSKRVTDARTLVSAVDTAISAAMADRRGPVHLALPFDLMTRESGVDVLPDRIPDVAPVVPASAAVESISQLLGQARRPLILVGPSLCRGAGKASLRVASQTLSAPIVSMESPRGLRDPSLGAIAEVVAESDLIVLLGKRLDFTTGFGRENVFGKAARIVVIDADVDMIRRAERLLGDRLAARCFADVSVALNALKSAARQPACDRGAWMERVAAASLERGIPAPATTPSIHPRVLCETVDTFLREVPSPVLVCDGGEFGQWAQAYCSAPARIINGMSGAIGGGICYAIAAKIARPESTVVLLMGDGTAGFHLSEFDTAVREQAAVVAVVGNDLRWNAEHVIQQRTYGEDRLIGCSLSATARYDAAVAGLGGFGTLVERLDEMAPALKAAVDSQQPACINVQMEGHPAPIFARNQVGASAH
ncbi:acetolactate synthase large subunit IlvG (plasmid) [Cupriavidus necator N-1]|uniref:Acetolactate synthase large subunit IlvG n=1 Tax=Cupriavidus necator (strain ATCC 43291 / DSM 13513 / CCUG 52238 / LMG 8453 / N-1) TaxID=1042878 RepID=F8GV50_CUPNN|nr:thiamine pyrophosphate-binding protein [Cupriavidus necator]AEI81477.1 acetolactate synthase large subunit IlvG [Cupriavidus necator N-1]MDX6007851.1 thiamine pyrophosphate-binding protein [Cupriavidus necator]